VTVRDCEGVKIWKQPLFVGKHDRLYSCRVCSFHLLLVEFTGHWSDWTGESVLPVTELLFL
jgi:hypothetical protein